MPNTKSPRRGQEKNRKGKIAERASSFHYPTPADSAAAAQQLIRPKTLPDLRSGRSGGSFAAEERPKLTKLLLNVTIQRTLGAVQVVMSPELSVGDLIDAALRQYAKEGRRPILPSVDPSDFDLHYSQFSLESLEREEKLISLGSRNFFLFLKSSPTATVSIGIGGGDDAVETEVPSSTECTESEREDRIRLPWLKFMDFLLVCMIS